jgi:hypothetical protein
VAFDRASHVVTNAHVVGAATTFQVFLAGSAKALPSRLVGSYPPDDLAVIKVRGAAHLVPAHSADSSKLQVGDIVLAMGNPLGLASSVTDGIVSATGRTVAEPAGAGSPSAALPDVVQTSAVINPGNSGGRWPTSPGRWLASPPWRLRTPSSAAPQPGSALPSRQHCHRYRRADHPHRPPHQLYRAALGVQVQTVTAPQRAARRCGHRRRDLRRPGAKAGLHKRRRNHLSQPDGTPTS